MKAKNAKSGHLYSADNEPVFLVGHPDSIHIWRNDYVGDTFYLYDKHLDYSVEIQETESEYFKKNTIKHLFEEKEEYFAQSF